MWFFKKSKRTMSEVDKYIVPVNHARTNAYKAVGFLGVEEVDKINVGLKKKIAEQAICKSERIMAIKSEIMQSEKSMRAVCAFVESRWWNYPE